MTPRLFPALSLMLDRRLVERAAGFGPSTATPGPRTAHERAENAVKWAAVLLGFSIPVSVALDNVLLGLILLFWIAGGRYRDKLAAVRGNPVALLALALYVLHLLGSLYSIGTARDVLEALAKASRLLLIPALIFLLREPVWRERGIAAFLASMLVTLVLSYLLWLGVLSGNGWLKGVPLDPVAFKAHITHNVFMAFAAFLLAQAALDAATRPGRIVLAALCAAMVANVLLMVPGRTGIVVLLVLFVYFLCRRFRLKGLALAGIALGALAAVVLASPESMLHKRVTLADEEYQQWRAGVPPAPTSSVGLRLELLRNTLEIIAQPSCFRRGHGRVRSGLCAPRGGARGRRDAQSAQRDPDDDRAIRSRRIGAPGRAVRDAMAAGGASARPLRTGGRAGARADVRRGECAVVDADGSRRGVPLCLHERTPLRGLSRRGSAIAGGRGMSRPGRPKGEYRSAQREGTPDCPPGRPGGRAPPLAPPASVLVVVTRRRGDVLLASPLIRSLKAAWPQAGIDVLVFAGTQGVLEANPDVRRVITIAERPGLFAHLALAARLLRRYDIALSCLAGDRPTAYAVVAGRWRVGHGRFGERRKWKRRVLSKAIPFDDLDTHTAAMNLAFAEILGIARHHEIGIGWTAQDAARASALLGERTRDSPYACCTCTRSSTTRCGTSKAGSAWRIGWANVGST